MVGRVKVGLAIIIGAVPWSFSEGEKKEMHFRKGTRISAVHSHLQLPTHRSLAAIGLLLLVEVPYPKPTKRKTLHDTTDIQNQQSCLLVNYIRT